MDEIVNPFTGFGDYRDVTFNPYKTNPFTFLGIDKQLIAIGQIEDMVQRKIDYLELQIDSGVLAKDLGHHEISMCTNALRYLQKPLDRLAFELLIESKCRQ